MKITRLPLLLLLACAVISQAQRTPDTLPPNFTGDDPATLLRQLTDLRQRLLKSEFEKTSAYEARIVEEKKKPILGSRTVEDTFYLVAHAVQAEYNADTETMSFTLPVQTNNEVQQNLDKKVITDLSRFARYQVSLGGESDPHVYFNNAVGLSGPANNQKFTATAKLNVEDARRLKTGAKAVLIVRFEEPYATRKYVEGCQFLTRLVGVQFFDQQTGTVLGQVGSSENTSESKQTAEPDYSTYRKNPTFKPPRILSKPDPRYTEEARRYNITGAVLLHVLLGENGEIARISVVKGLPHGLTERAIAAARLITFEPAQLDGKKVAYPVTVVYRFELF